MSESIRHALLSLLPLALWSGVALAQFGEVRGVVVDKRRQPVPAATVMLGGAHEAVTDSAGVFSMRGVKPGNYTLRVRHIAYDQRSLPIDVAANQTLKLQLTLAETVIELAPLEIEAISAHERQERGAGYGRNFVGRAELEKAQNSNMRLPDALRAAVPGVRVRRLERLVGSPVCIELRTVRAQGPLGCLSPAVYLDGVPVSNPSSLYDNLDLRAIESVEIVPASEAGVRFGTGALYGALLITTRRPGYERAPDKQMHSRGTSFNWKMDPEPHNTKVVFAASAAMNAAGVLIGVGAATRCIELREPANDALISKCSLGLSLATAASAFIMPAVGSGLAARWTGGTSASVGQFRPAAIGSAMMLLPGYGLVLSGYRNDSDGLKTAGYALVLLGPPLIATTADYLFRRLRNPEPRE